MKIKSSKIIITGGMSGLGNACVNQLLRLGSFCAIIDNKDQTSINLSKRLLFLKTDISSEQNVQKSVDYFFTKMGSIHVLINCAGIGFSSKVVEGNNIGNKEFMREFNKTIQVNLIGTMNVVKIVAEKMLSNIPNADGERGVIINTASIAAFEGQVGQAAYSASKAGIVGMMLPIAREFANYGIRILTISPGFFDTPMFSKIPEKIRSDLFTKLTFPKRLARPMEYAKLVTHIIENPILNAENIRIDSAVRM